MGQSGASASIDLIRVLIKYAVDRGIDMDDIHQATGLAPEMLQDARSRVPVDELIVIWREIESRSADPDFGLHVAESSLKHFGGDLISAVMMNCPTLGTAMQKLVRYHDLSIDWVRLRLSQRGAYAYYSWTPIGSKVQIGRQVSEAVLGTMALRLCNLTENRLRLVEIRFSHARPDRVDEHRRILDAPLTFRHARNELVINRDDLGLPIFLANPAVLERLEGMAQEMLSSIYTPDSWADRVSQLIGRSLARGDWPTLKSVAAELAISPRHLQNKLKAEETSYRDILD